MNKVKILQGIIEENIEWFWGNDPMLDYETNMSKLWKGFKTWCVQNCVEVMGNMEEFIIDKMVEKNYSNWRDKNIF